jgi:hypothetical protein
LRCFISTIIISMCVCPNQYHYLKNRETGRQKTLWKFRGFVCNNYDKQARVYLGFTHLCTYVLTHLSTHACSKIAPIRTFLLSTSFLHRFFTMQWYIHLHIPVCWVEKEKIFISITPLCLQTVKISQASHITIVRYYLQTTNTKTLTLSLHNA